MVVSEPTLIDLPKILDVRGNLSFIEVGNHIPFAVSRCYWIYDVPGGETRGGHSYHNNQELIVALSGSLDVILDNGSEKKAYSLNRSYYGLYVPNGTWRHMENFSTNAFSLVLASSLFSEDDYERDYTKYLISKMNGKRI